MTIIHDALDLTVQPPSRHETWGPPASDICWSSLETCSKLFNGPHCTWPLPVLTSGGHWSTYGWHPTGMLSCYKSFYAAVDYFTLHILMQMYYWNVIDSRKENKNWLQKFFKFMTISLKAFSVHILLKSFYLKLLWNEIALNEYLTWHFTNRWNINWYMSGDTSSTIGRETTGYR